MTFPISCTLSELTETNQHVALRVSTPSTCRRLYCHHIKATQLMMPHVALLVDGPYLRQAAQGSWSSPH